VLAATDTELVGPVCAYLTPLIREQLRSLESGQVLEVRTTDETAKLDVSAWCRLSGHLLIAMVEEGAISRFFIRKK
jgi:TusA-related sulfurtransferase